MSGARSSSRQPDARHVLTRLMAALLYLKHAYALSDEDMVERWTENPYWQHFNCVRYFQHALPCDPSSLVSWRQRIGEAGCEWLLAQTIEAARRGGVVKRASLDRVVLNTTVQPKAIAHPTDSRLPNRAREQLVLWRSRCPRAFQHFVWAVGSELFRADCQYFGQWNFTRNNWIGLRHLSPME